ncbi:sensor histidine kinase [Mucilaginibacter ginsenosidivorax]|uniref:GHKL domain-containing protein n=1 Tax=Mucilaginibacter ginsenosidivorax TaxID=862126 RepID=A0A5B8W8P1_9SPHI|nr:histidine kinase [Mucilaginibacter ginsenosidivorax]QEC79827.1 GHKL domain-containing protein [Mucilaginibacter ginsenosidivorax]
MKTFDWTRLFTWPYKIYTQLLFWVIVFLLYILLKEYPQRMSGITLICLVFQETLELIIPCYSQNLLVLPFLKHRKWLVGFVIYAVQLVVLIELLPYFLNLIGLLFAKLFHITDVVTNWQEQHFAFTMVAFTVMASLAKVGMDRLIRDKEQKENELRHLKAQLNPHFLFNTLNNLYGLSVAESKKLPDLMLKLSDLLRYSLYDTNQHYVALQKEIEYLNNYVELERIRLSGNSDIELTFEGDTAERYIAPLLMIVFIENAFKHFSAAKGEKSFVHIRLAVNGDELHLKVQNSVDPGFAPILSAKRKGGLGLENARQRLNLIYPGQYQLKINKNQDIFETNLIVELT